jgi:hypothetical protein
LRKKDTIDQTGEKKQGFASFSKRIKIKVDFLLTKKNISSKKKQKERKGLVSLSAFVSLKDLFRRILRFFLEKIKFSYS